MWVEQRVRVGRRRGALERYSGPDDWFEMNEGQRKAYVNEFNKMSVGDAMKGKAIRVNHVRTEEISECKEFSLDVTTILKSFHYCAGQKVWSPQSLTTLKHCSTPKMLSSQCRPWTLMVKGSFWWLQKTVKEACTSVQSSVIM